MEGRNSLIKSLREDQMDMLMMMEQMDKLPDFGSSSPATFSDVSDLSSGSGYSSAASPHGIYDSNPLNFMNAHPPTLPFMAGNPNTEPLMPIFSDTAARVDGASGSSLSSSSLSVEQKPSSVAAMREMIFRIAAMQPIHIDPESVKPLKRRNVKISTDPQSVAARHRRERISERIRILQRLVPGGTKMDTASMLDEAIHYVKFLKTQVQSLERAAAHRPNPTVGISGGAYLSVGMSYQPGAGQMFAPPTQLLS